MKSLIPTLGLCLACTLSSFSQQIKPQRSTLGSAGSSSKSGGNVYILQSIGQTSAIGSFNSHNKVIRQGFIQPIESKRRIAPKKELQIEIFPNPVISGITLRILENIDESPTVQFIDINGRVVLRKSLDLIPESTIDMTSFTSGIYFIEVRAGKKVGRVKLLKR
jgi:hypothetical protein